MMPGRQKISSKSIAFDLAHKPLTLAEMAAELGVSRERARQIRVDAGAKPIRTYRDAMVEIRRLQSIIDENQYKPVAAAN